MTPDRSIALYRRLAALYPKAFRDEYHDDLVAVFAEQLRDEGPSRTWARAVRDLLITIPSQQLEARMHRPAAQTVALVATAATLAAFVLAVIAGTGPVVGVFLAMTLAGLVITVLAWRAARPVGRVATVEGRWRILLLVGLALLAAVLVVVNVPPYADRELPEAGWAVMMLSLVTSIGLITVGLTMGVARRISHRPPTPLP